MNNKQTTNEANAVGNKLVGEPPTEAAPLAPTAGSDLPIPDALYSCKHCRDEYSWPADDLYWSEKTKAWVCLNCWDEDHDGEERGIRLDREIKRQNDEGQGL